MMSQTHMLGGAVSAMLFTMAAAEGTAGLSPLTTPEFCGVMFSALTGSLAPDIDRTSSKAGKAFSSLSKVISSLFGHRTFCHSLLFLVICFAAVKNFVPSMSLYAAAFCAGGLSHLILDMFNPTGVPLLWPISRRFRCGKIRTESTFGKQTRAVRKNNRQERIFRAAILFLFVVTFVETVALKIAPFGGMQL